MQLIAEVAGSEVDHDLPLDSHLHTNLSPDSSVPIDVYCAAALERRIPEIAITDHVDFDPAYPAYAYASFEERERVVREAAERWAEHGIDVRFGVEITYERQREQEIREHLARHAYDFVIGSVHIGRHTPYGSDRVKEWVAGRSIATVVEPYFSEVLDAVRSGLFDALGHLDFVKRYVHPYLTAPDFAAAPELYEPILRALVESGTALEINTSGLRQGPAETYPAPWVVARFRELGGRAVTTGSDAHQAESFAFGLSAGYAAAERAGFAEVAFRRGGERVWLPLSGVRGAQPVAS